MGWVIQGVPIFRINMVHFSIKKYWYMYLIPHKNIYCGYSLEVPQWGALTTTYVSVEK